MSRFFRSADSTSSSSSGSEEVVDETIEEQFSESSRGDQQSLSRESTLSLEAPTELAAPVDLSSEGRASHHKDALLHALLEDWCLNEVLASQGNARRDAAEVQAEARARYLRLASQLSLLNLTSPGLEQDQHAATRQQYRDGLGMLSRQHSEAVVPTTFRRMLTDGATEGMPPAVGDQAMSGSSWRNAASSNHLLQAPLRQLLGHAPDMDTTEAVGSPVVPSTPLGLVHPSNGRGFYNSRYHNDFEELKVLGHGGYGIVYHARNRLDNQAYAVKKVPLSAARLRRIQQRGQPEVDAILLELRTLARLHHPNIVRYYNAWIEWAEAVPSRVAHSGEAGNSFRAGSEGAFGGAEESNSRSLQRIVTEDELYGSHVLFDSSDIREASKVESDGSTSDSRSADELRLRRASTKGTIATVSDDTAESIGREPETSASIRSTADGAHFAQPTLAIHMQMSLHPMTLADLLSDQNVRLDQVEQHCYHIEPSVRIVLAVLEGLDYLHSEGICHRDIKPANIFLSPAKSRGSRHNSADLSPCSDCHNKGPTAARELDVCIGDFGLASVAGSDVDAESDVAVGTAIYRSATAAPRSPNLDIYALGVVFFELLWKFETRMERHHIIHDLKEGRYPNGFCERVGKSRGVKAMECIDVMLGHDEQANSIQALKERLSALNML